MDEVWGDAFGGGCGVGVGVVELDGGNGEGAGWDGWRGATPHTTHQLLSTHSLWEDRFLSPFSWICPCGPDGANLWHYFAVNISCYNGLYHNMARLKCGYDAMIYICITHVFFLQYLLGYCVLFASMWKCATTNKCLLRHYLSVYWPPNTGIYHLMLVCCPLKIWAPANQVSRLSLQRQSN